MKTTQTAGRWRRCWELFCSFFKIGLFTFGGGYVMISVIQNEFVDKKKWMSREEMMDMVAIAESTPGPIAINSATYVGFRNAGFFGALCATTATVLPAFGIIFLISLFFSDFLAISWVARAFRGIQAAVAVLILQAALKLAKGITWSPAALALLAAVLILEIGGAILGFGISSILLIFIGAVVGLVLHALGQAKEGRL